MKLYLFIFFCFLTTCAQSQIVITNLDITKLPKSIKFTGKIKNAVSWRDQLGENIVITTETGINTSKTNDPLDDFREASLYAYHYILNKDSTNLIWKVYDFIKDCPFDVEANFIKKTFQITDLNNDGTAEVWLMYKTVCHSDVSPSDMKIIMYQGKQKYAIRGQNKVQVSKKEFTGGDYKFDPAFVKAPTVFKEFAKKLWQKNILQKWGE